MPNSTVRAAALTLPAPIAASADNGAAPFHHLITAQSVTATTLARQAGIKAD